MGPRAATKKAVSKMSAPGEMLKWVEECRVAALLGSCPKSHSSLLSGVAAWKEYAGDVLGLAGREFPPTINGLVSWSATFDIAGALVHAQSSYHAGPACTGTFTNYLGHVKHACNILDVSDAAFGAVAVRRAKAAVRKRDALRKRDPQFVRHHLLYRMVVKAKKHFDETKDVACWRSAMMFLMTYVFMLRLPSETLPISVKKALPGHVGQAAVASLEDGELVLRLESRKNLQQGSTLRRRCWCHTHPETCPVHVMWPFFAAFPEGAQPFACFDGKEASSWHSLTPLPCLLARFRHSIAYGLSCSNWASHATRNSRPTISGGVTLRTWWQLAQPTRKCAGLANGKQLEVLRPTWIGPASNAIRWTGSGERWNRSPRMWRMMQPCPWKEKAWVKKWRQS